MINVNPFAYLSDSVKVMALADVAVANSQEIHNKVYAEGYHGEFTVKVQPGTSFINVAVNGSSQQETERTTGRVLKELQDIVDSFQTRSPQAQRLSVQVLQQPNVFKAKPDGSSKLLLVIAVLGLAASIGGAVAVDLWRRRRDVEDDRPAGAGAPPAPRDENRGDVSPDTVRLQPYGRDQVRPAPAAPRSDDQEAYADTSGLRKA
ncbi:hypothetical protein BCD48_30150 [Pseudofrankia sp. BMG5.36]|nr:hypothetical protein BCD48_30150 [Pseudofrankia sp. BMG5.36]